MTHRRRIARQPRPAPQFRRAGPSDIDACGDLWQRALRDYLRRLNQPEFFTDLAPIRRLLTHLLTTDPERFWVATARPPTPGATSAGGPPDASNGTADEDERLLGFASANVRGSAWFLAMLFIDPDDQGRGLGRALLERTLPAGARPGRPDDAGWTFATVTDSVQPISNALYARLGIVPQVPMLHLAGIVRRRAAFPPLPDGISAVRFEAVDPTDAVAAIDRRVLGYEHPADHGFVRADGRVGILYRGRDGDAVGYGYTSRVGRVGPIAAVDPELLPAIAGDVLATVEPNGVFSTWVPGAAASTVQALLEAGLRLEPFPALHCWDRASVDDRRYVPITLALL
ncbi:MAG TPA: GNAT family N-acetyltransferase [Candidatus Limnocylindrales bacterium]|nr:GNAT family N-acetyltransferase [Candidatus Limnocylindrales bacterium]